MNGACKIKVGGGGRSCYAAHAARHLERNCNEVGRNSIKERLLKKVQN